MSTEQAVIQFEHTTKRFGRKLAVSDVSGSFPRGSVVGLIGPNGSGKSTLLKLAAGLIRPTSGKVWVSGNVVNGRIRSGVSFLPDTNSLYPFYTVGETIHYCVQAFPDFDLNKALKMMEFLELSHGQKVSHLSKGKYSRLKLVVTLSRETPLVLMDEPLSGLDPMVRKSILKSLIEFVDVDWQTVVLSTHEVAEIEPLLDHVALIHQGQLKGFDTVDNIRAEHNTSLVTWMEALVQEAKEYQGSASVSV
ncbi:ABC transporter ATP-binding protein [Alicyclobacillus dauci]|uniref:ABC transporter ATP-binding protein n=1 Tax=Alicyclobacillus dauci TaxID=1475485 RepID=A0ABY6Z4D7_9BACL|nr:ABC transporter ATP-binding protein [Alicyclobacillus dauci]WAH37744.1 ABC transporter ATP-binding protein [Alicyclobacillus dauci]